MKTYVSLTSNSSQNSLKKIICFSDIEIGEFIKLIAEKNGNRSLKGLVFIVREINKENVNIDFNSPNIYFNKKLEDYNLENNIKINISSGSSFELHWKMMKYKEGEYNYPPPYINDECPFNFEDIGSQQNIENINEAELGLTNDPPNVIIIKVNKYNYAYNKKCLYKWLMINKNKDVTLPINNHILTKIDIQNIFDICIKIQTEKFSDREPYSLYKIDTEMKITEQNVITSPPTQVEEMLPNPLIIFNNSSSNGIQGLIPMEGNSDITPHCVCCIS
tara:strand:- start:2033 stop:2860 length:828 start_codon:yes stop_codon:yes gene_type:complete